MICKKLMMVIRKNVSNDNTKMTSEQKWDSFYKLKDDNKKKVKKQKNQKYEEYVDPESMHRIGPSKRNRNVIMKKKDNTVQTEEIREQCDCQATIHHLVNNCLSCGRVVCSKEGPGPCFFFAVIWLKKGLDMSIQKNLQKML